MTSSNAHVPTPMAERYVRQLCSHWGHRFAVTQEGPAGTIDFGDGKSCALEANDSELHVAVTAPEGEIERMQQVVAEHLNRFAHREGELTFDWARA
ncbi:DUF2218 domain-containing protein [Sandaracinobacteroides hominis]|uniref:DUF2218 domain-containing protein n=1 Tax=Sandaracinobacteroides hominis TaxID=2780086 RepID=UPI0018F7032A|nr:DUF2218 domain-containing protein [Sandaracinobacteroides hominis]